LEISGYDYGNARVRAMKSRLLTRHELEALTEHNSPQSLISALTNTDYREAVQASLVRKSGMAAITEILRHNLVHTLGKVRSFYSGDARKLVSIVLRGFDVSNIKTILRSLSKGIPPEEIETLLFPVGMLTEGALAELARALEPRVAIDLVASMGLPIAQPLLKLRAERPGANIMEMELALDRWYIEGTRRDIEKQPRAIEFLNVVLDLDADLTNLLTVLRFVPAPEERQILRQQIGTDDIRHLFIGPGRLPFRLLIYAVDQDTMESMVEALMATAYGPPLRAGLTDYLQSDRLSDIERQLRLFRLRRMAYLLAKDPLGIGVVLGYTALKTNEVANIRRIAIGLRIRLGAEAIKADLEFAR
jgi:vacuolar-type H+-ATPase subunit C/Vma6